MKIHNFLTQSREDAKTQNFYFLLFTFYFKTFAPLRLCVFALILSVFNFAIFAQEQQPTPGAAKTVVIPAVKEKKLPNGLTVAVVERKNVPLVTIQLLIKSGANSEDATKAGLADMTASLLTKGTKTRSATQIAEQIEFLGGSITTGAGWNNSVVTINVMADKLDQAMAILADVVLNPAFKQEEIDLLKAQTLDGLAYNLTQPGFLGNYVASKYSFDEHPIGGTVESVKGITREDIVGFKTSNYLSDVSTLIFTGDISSIKANALTQKFFGGWRKPKPREKRINVITRVPDSLSVVKRILVVDLPDSGQAAVSYARNIRGVHRQDAEFYSSSVLNSVLGGGYSSRLNQEIRIKRGLSYGAGSSFAWRGWKTNFRTTTQTKNESAAEVAELVAAEIKKLTDSNVSATELNPRKLVLNGDFGRDLETTNGLAGALADLYVFGLPTSELNSYMKSVQAVTDTQVRDFAKQNLLGGDIIIVGDYAKFKDDLAKRFPNMTIDVIKADELDLSKDNLRK